MHCHHNHSCACHAHSPDLLQRICPTRAWERDFSDLRRQWSQHSKNGLLMNQNNHAEGSCCKCMRSKQVRGRFGVAWLAETPGHCYSEPYGWQVEFVDTPSRVDQRCKDMVKWINSPPLPKEDTVENKPNETNQTHKEQSNDIKSVSLDEQHHKNGCSCAEGNHSRTSEKYDYYCDCYGTRIRESEDCCCYYDADAYDNQRMHPRCKCWDNYMEDRCSCPNCCQNVNDETSEGEMPEAEDQMAEAGDQVSQAEHQDVPEKDEAPRKSTTKAQSKTTFMEEPLEDNAKESSMRLQSSKKSVEVLSHGSPKESSSTKNSVGYDTDKKSVASSKHSSTKISTASPSLASSRRKIESSTRKKTVEQAPWNNLQRQSLASSVISPDASLLMEVSKQASSRRTIGASFSRFFHPASVQSGNVNTATGTFPQTVQCYRVSIPYSLQVSNTQGKLVKKKRWLPAQVAELMLQRLRNYMYFHTYSTNKKCCPKTSECKKSVQVVYFNKNKQ